MKTITPIHDYTVTSTYIHTLFEEEGLNQGSQRADMDLVL